MTGKILSSIKKKVDKEGNESYIVGINYICDSFDDATKLVKTLGVED